MGAKLFDGIDTLDTIQVVLVVIISVLLANYLYVRWMMVGNRRTDLDDIEAFANPDDSPEANIVVFGNETLYDKFYAKIYDTIVDGALRQQQEVGLSLIWAKGYRPEVKTIEVLGNQILRHFQIIGDLGHSLDESLSVCYRLASLLT